MYVDSYTPVVASGSVLLHAFGVQKTARSCISLKCFAWRAALMALSSSKPDAFDWQLCCVPQFQSQGLNCPSWDVYQGSFCSHAFLLGHALHSYEEGLPDSQHIAFHSAPSNHLLSRPPTPPLCPYSLTCIPGLISSDICNRVLSRKSLWITLPGLLYVTSINWISNSFIHFSFSFTLLTCFPLVQIIYLT